MGAPSDVASSNEASSEVASKERHLDRSNEQAHRSLRSGETPHLPLPLPLPLPLSALRRHPERSEGSRHIPPTHTV